MTTPLLSLREQFAEVAAEMPILGIDLTYAPDESAKVQLHVLPDAAEQVLAIAATLTPKSMKPHLQSSNGQINGFDCATVSFTTYESLQIVKALSPLLTEAQQENIGDTIYWHCYENAAAIREKRAYCQLPTINARLIGKTTPQPDFL